MKNKQYKQEDSEHRTHVLMMEYFYHMILFTIVALK